MMSRVMRFRIVCLLAVLCLWGIGCVDMVRLGLTDGVTRGIRDAISDSVQDFVEGVINR